MQPIPLDIVSISEIKNFPYTLSEETYPCLLLKIADHEQMYLFAESEAASKTWYQKLESTIQERLDARVDVCIRGKINLDESIFNNSCSCTLIDYHTKSY